MRRLLEPLASWLRLLHLHSRRPLAMKRRKLGVNSIEKFQVEFWLEKPLEFLLERFHTPRKSSKMGSLDVTGSKWNLKTFFWYLPAPAP